MSIYRPVRIYSASNETPLVLDRLGYLSSLAAGKAVLHIGCADYPITEERLKAGQLLHARLQGVASDLLGIDISNEGLGLLRAHGFSNVLEMDAENLRLQRTYDLVMAGDTLEHMNNPGRFLEGVRGALAENGELVIGVPSAFSFNAIRLWVQGVELTHKDHIAFHSPKTLAELGRRFELLPTRLVFTVQPRDVAEGSFFLFARSCVLRVCKKMSPSIIMHFRKKESLNLDQFFEWN